MGSVTRNQFPVKNFRLIPCLFHLWIDVVRMQLSARLNHRKKMKAEHIRLVLRKPAGNLELLFGLYE